MIPAIVTQAVAVAAADRTGVIEYRVTQSSRIDGGPIHEHDDLVYAIVLDGTQTVKVRVLSLVEDGKVQGDRERQKIQAELETEKERFDDPTDPRWCADYAYTVDGSTVKFVGLKRDGEHGDGWFVLDPAGHVLKMSYSPDVMPQYASSGTITFERDQVLPGVWAAVSSNTVFSGHYLFFHGSATFVWQKSGFRRFDDRASALTDLASLQE